MTDLTVYRVKNRKTGEYLKTRRGKTTWSTAGSAKNGWNAAQPYRDGNGNRMPSFNEQDEWVVEENVIVTASYLAELKERDEWLQCLDNAGVDNWSGIDFAHSLRKGEEY